MPIKPIIGGLVNVPPNITPAPIPIFNLLLMVGDSQQLVNTPWNSYLNIFNCNVNNIASSGASAANWLSAYTDQIHPFAPASGGVPACIVFWVGGPDINANGQTGAQVNTSIDSLNTLAIADGFSVIFMTLTKWTVMDVTQQGYVDTVNTHIRAMSGLAGYIDTALLLPDMSNSAYSSDGVHPNIAGNLIIYNSTKTGGTYDISGLQNIIWPLASSAYLSVDTDDTLQADSNSRIPSQKAVKEYVASSSTNFITNPLTNDLDIGSKAIVGSGGNILDSTSVYFPNSSTAAITSSGLNYINGNVLSTDGNLNDPNGNLISDGSNLFAPDGIIPFADNTGLIGSGSNLTGLTPSQFGVTPIANGTYTVGLGVTTNGTITITNGIITAIQQAS